MAHWLPSFGQASTLSAEQRLPAPSPPMTIWFQHAPWRDGLGFLVVRHLLGFLLVASASLKLLESPSPAFAWPGILGSPRLSIGVAEAEALLGLWLLTGAQPRLLWLTALLSFFVLTIASLAMAVQGHPSCGCFGQRLGVSPWFAVAIDLSSLAALLLWRPRTPRDPLKSVSLSRLRRLLYFSIGSGALAAASLGVLASIMGSTTKALSELRGEHLLVEPSVTQLGEGRRGEKRTFTVRIINNSSRPVRVVGGTTACSCVVTRQLPITIPSEGSQAIDVQVVFHGQPGPFTNAFVFNTDDRDQPQIVARFEGHVIRP
jgi:hypothetical protein